MLEGFKSINLVCALGLFLSIIPKSTSLPLVIRQITERYKDVGAKDFNAIACVCPNGTTFEKELDRITASEILGSSRRCSYTKDVCDLMDECGRCVLHTEFCQSSNDGKDFDCFRDVYILRDGYFKSNSSNNFSRLKRQLKGCQYPSNLKTADVFCRIGARNVACKQTCIIGYTFEEGRKLKLTCKRSENKWVPHGFKECLPYVDCTLSLTSAGLADCYTATTKSHAMCYIQCDKYEDKDSVHRRAYSCKEDGKWDRELPFCAVAGSNIAIVSPPPEYADEF